MDVKEYWKRYDAGVQYNSGFKQNKDWYESIKVWNDYYQGDQWVGVSDKDAALPKMVFNYVKRVADFKIASLTSSDISVNVEPLSNMESFDANFVNAEIKNIFEKWNFRVLKKQALRKGAISGDMCAHIIFNPNARPYRGMQQETQGEMEIELIDATNVLFGNANIRNVSKQPYIIVVGRDTVENLKAEAKGNKDEIVKDNNTDYQLTSAADVEVEIENEGEGKAKYIYYYYKKDNKVYVSKCTKDAIIYKDIDIGLSDYPIAFTNWYDQENTYHGRGEVEGICPNQMAINKMFAMMVYQQMMTSFPPVLYNKNLISKLTNQVGGAIGINVTETFDLGNAIKYLEPVNMSDAFIRVIDLAIQYSKECMGVSDASLGQVDPKNTSAILAVQKSTAVPLENVRDNLYDFVEQIVRIMIDMMGSKYGTRPAVVEDEDGNRQIGMYDFSQLKDMDLHLGIDVGEASYYSEIAALQSLDNLLSNGFIEFLEYLERVPNEMIPKKSELIGKLKEKQQTEKQAVYEQLSQYMQFIPQEYAQQFVQTIDTITQ